MIVHDEPLIRIYFGDASDHLCKEEYLTWQDSSLLLRQPSMQSVIKHLQVQKLFFLRQVHSTQGYCVDAVTMASFQPFTKEGDFLITSLSAIGLGVMAADCLPVICVDTVKKIIGIAHAGWRGALAGVVKDMLHTMQVLYRTHLSNCRFYFGPSAQRCCYRVGPEFTTYLADYSWRYEVLQEYKGAYFFDVPLFISYQLQMLGVAKRSIDTTYNVCTICNNCFYSHRRSGIDYNGRQMTVVALK